METEDLALKQYDVVLRYLIYENTVYWTRSSFFLAANAGLFGFVASKLPAPPHDIHYIIALAVGCIGGIILSGLWHQALRVGEYWTSRWERICISLEERAFDKIEVLRNCRLNGRDSGKQVAHRTAMLFTILWSLALVYTIVISLKFFHSTYI